MADEAFDLMFKGSGSHVPASRTVNAHYPNPVILIVVQRAGDACADLMGDKQGICSKPAARPAWPNEILHHFKTYNTRQMEHARGQRLDRQMPSQ